MSANEIRSTGNSAKDGPPFAEDLVSTPEQAAGKTSAKHRAKEKAEQVRDKAEQVREKVGDQAGQTAQTVKAKATQAGEQVKGTVGDLTGKAREAVASDDIAPKARRSGAGVAAVVTAVLGIWAWRRRARRNASRWDKASRLAKSQARNVRREAKAKAKSAKARGAKAVKSRGRH